MQCPFCLKDEQRELGGILLFAPDGMRKEQPTAAGRACNTCLSLLSHLLDVWLNGGINSFIQKMKDNHMIKETTELVESGSFRI